MDVCSRDGTRTRRGVNPCLVRRRILLYLAVGHQLPTGVLAIRTSMIIVGHAGSRGEDAQYPPFNREANLRLSLATYTRERVWEEVCNRLRNIAAIRSLHAYTVASWLVSPPARRDIVLVNWSPPVLRSLRHRDVCHHLCTCLVL